MTEKFICAFEGPWHLAKVKEMRGDKTGEVIAKFVVTACNGKQIGGPWGPRTWRHEFRPQHQHICKRCAALLKKEETNEQAS